MLSWNVRGIGGNRFRERLEIERIVKRHSLEIVVFTKTHTPDQEEAAKETKSIWPKGQWDASCLSAALAGIMVMWKGSLSASTIYKDEKGRSSDKKGGTKKRVRRDEREMFADLKYLLSCEEGNWQGPMQFTWRNKRTGQEEVKERLERLYMSTELWNKISKYCYFPITAVEISDHCPIMFQATIDNSWLQRKNVPFKLNVAYLKDKGFLNNLHIWWKDLADYYKHASPSIRWVRILKNLKGRIKEWEKHRTMKLRERKEKMILDQEQIEAEIIKHYKKVCTTRELSLLRSKATSILFSKLMAKVLAVRMSSFMNELIDDSQSTFVKGRKITNSITMVTECLHTKRMQRKGMMILKVDISKAYDTLEWDYLLSMLCLKGVSMHNLKWLMACLKTTNMAILVNGRLTEIFSTSRGIRQGFSLSPYLFIITAEGLFVMLYWLNQIGLIEGYPADGKRIFITHQLFVDDLILIGKNSISEVLSWDQALRVYTEVPLVLEDSLINYLGVLISVRKLRSQDWIPFLEKIKGGLGIRDPYLLEDVRGAKRCWDFLQEGQRKWKEVLLRKYYFDLPREDMLRGLTKVADFFDFDNNNWKSRSSLVAYDNGFVDYHILRDVDNLNEELFKVELKLGNTTLARIEGLNKVALDLVAAKPKISTTISTGVQFLSSRRPRKAT
eukprot:Gb_21728 [translate_table: standard]